MRKMICLVASMAATFSVQASDDLTNELALIDSWLSAQRAYDHVPALSAAIVHDQDLIWSGSSGFADVASNRPASDDTIYGICSISKLFTGIAVMQLRDQGKVHLDDSVDDLLPWYDLKQTHLGSPDITLRSMLTHSAGLPRESDSPYWMGPDFPFPTREEVREKLQDQTTIYPAQRYYQYSNLGLTLVGEVVAEVSGQDYESYIDDHILAPLAMHDTATGFPTDDREPRIATGYGFAGKDSESPVMPRYDALGITPAAGFASTVLDLARFASWQFRLLSGESDEVLKGNTLREMQRVQWMDLDWSVARGLGFGVYRIGDRTYTGHGGDCPGFNTRLYLDPVSQYAVVTMANRNRVDVDGYAATIFNILDAGGTIGPDDSDSSLPVLNLGDYVGSYDSRPWDGELMVIRWKEGLTVLALPTMDPIENMVQLKHIEGDRFHTIRPDDEPGHEVAFRRDESGEVTHVIYHSIDLPKL